MLWSFLCAFGFQPEQTSDIKAGSDDEAKQDEAETTEFYVEFEHQPADGSTSDQQQHAAGDQQAGDQDHVTPVYEEYQEDGDTPDQAPQHVYEETPKTGRVWCLFFR